MDNNFILINFAIDSMESDKFDKFFEDVICKTFTLCPVSELDILCSILGSKECD